MHAPGTGFMAFFTHVDAAIEKEYVAFLIREHMPERLNLPGFSHVRLFRSVSGAAPCPYFALYETADLAALTSEPYIERLSNPTPWTHDFMPKLTGSVRGAGASLASVGSGAGGFVAVARRRDPVVHQPAHAQMEAVADLPFVLGVHILAVDARSTAVRTPGTARDGNPVRFETLVLCEASQPDAAEEAVAACEALLPDAGDEKAFRHTYRLAFSLDRRDLG